MENRIAKTMIGISFIALWAFAGWELGLLEQVR